MTNYRTLLKGIAYNNQYCIVDYNDDSYFLIHAKPYNKLLYNYLYTLYIDFEVEHTDMPITNSIRASIRNNNAFRQFLSLYLRNLIYDNYGKILQCVYNYQQSLKNVSLPDYIASWDHLALSINLVNFSTSYDINSINIGINRIANYRSHNLYAYIYTY